MSKMYEKVKKYYDTGLWSEERVRNMVIKGIITEEEYKDITGNEYQEYILLFCSTVVEVPDGGSAVDAWLYVSGKSVTADTTEIKAVKVK